MAGTRFRGGGEAYYLLYSGSLFPCRQRGLFLLAHDQGAHDIIGLISRLSFLVLDLQLSPRLKNRRYSSIRGE